MSSNILYKWRSGTTFESLNLLGSAAKLFEVKKAIVLAKRLNSSSMDFDLIVTDADTQEEYTDETKNLRTGRRLIVQRVPARAGHGFLARMARHEQGGDIAAPPSHLQNKSSSVPGGFYTIDGRAREADEEEFVDTAADDGGDDDEDKELAALQAVTSIQHQGPIMTGGTGGRRGGPPVPAGMGGPPRHQSRPANFHGRPNADPDLREHEMKEPKRLTGIPRTFMNLTAQSQADGGNDGEDGVGVGTMGALLQPNKRGFDELVKRKGGQSANTAGTRRDLDYALKLTSTTIPDHLKCAITGNLVKNAMLLPWDPEGRTVSETAIRDALTQNMFRCPLTGTEGVSPDDLIPNIGLRKAADAFVKSVMEKVDEIEQQKVEDSVPESMEEETKGDAEKNVVDGDGVETGVITSSKRNSLSSHRKTDNDLFGDDDFGGDVFAVPVKKGRAVDSTKEATSEPQDASTADDGKDDAERPKDDSSPIEANDVQSDAFKDESKNSHSPSSGKTGEGRNDSQVGAPPRSRDSRSNNRPEHGVENNSVTSSHTSNVERSQAAPPAASSHRRARRRGPPAGYAMGLRGGRGSNNQRNQAPSNNSGGRGHHNESGYAPHGDRGAGRAFSPRGGGQNPQGGRFDRGEGGRGGPRFHGGDGSGGYGDDESRGTKRSRDDQSQDGDSTGGSVGVPRIKCFNCQEDGHFARDCPKYNPRMNNSGGRGGRGGAGRGPDDFRGGRGRGGWDLMDEVEDSKDEVGVEEEGEVDEDEDDTKNLVTHQ
eukprot:CAMPEP_0113498702 /NCGR_PEP_ID=MMETSP0014_2-20120614/31326_1 /TAXON_ID=2857 /ORGANISM="Nitzschia sp." /LENGTH=766 /DNA_ID=CAMNT_0000392769 /DNA_START=641 /DNA_END=2942 /DNA_ORIENTATION=- /assembly_acc=CAM_ASM_000159